MLDYCKFKIEHWFIDFSATNKIDYLTCVIIHDNLTCVHYHEMHNKQNNTINNTWHVWKYEIISCVEKDISLIRFAHSWDILVNTQNKFNISAHPCIILYAILYIQNIKSIKLSIEYSIYWLID